MLPLIINLLQELHESKVVQSTLIEEFGEGNAALACLLEWTERITSEPQGIHLAHPAQPCTISELSSLLDNVTAKIQSKCSTANDIPSYRVSHQVVSILLGIAHLILPPSNLPLGPDDTSIPHKNIQKALHIMDRSLIVTGFPVYYLPCLELIYCLHDKLPTLNLSKCEPALESVSKSNSCSLFSKVKSFDDPALVPWYEDPNLIAAPFVIRGGVSHWPATTWTFTSLCKSMGHRMVPIEIGSSYLHPAWSQTILPFHEFVTSYVTLREGSSTGYLAQHALFFRQLPHLRSDIFIPDEIYLFSKCNHCQEIALGSSPCTCLESTTLPKVDINVWIGPQGTITPLHHDGHRTNMFAQVKGTKSFVFVAPTALAADSTEEKLANTCPHNVFAQEFITRVGAENIFHCDVHSGDLLYIPVRHSQGGWQRRQPYFT
jgi:lysine-specific demethylase 8